MERMAIGLMISAELDPIKALKRARALGITVVDLHLKDEFCFGGRREDLKSALASSGVNVNTVYCSHPGEGGESLSEIMENMGYRNPAFREERIKRTFQLSGFARFIGADRVGAHMGFIPEDRDNGTYSGLVDAARGIGEHCSHNDQIFTLETGLETAQTLLRFIEDVGRDNVKVNFDPGNLIICGKGDPIEALEMLRDHVAGVHCKDAKWPTKGSFLGQECPLGEGDVDIERFIGRLEAIGYNGPLVIEREITGEQRWRDILEARKLLEKLRK